ncbi:pyrroline-5-carboxylate reductase [Ruminococcus sp.]|uniref:pyrroline-5-carboxylate reductase n=1 Tax=Ruminococcus sp. TaxID=41978 RepID=UPI002B793791|nr:pyrroline-5-carboxylate reductase [Ruminococcus sp.]HNZ99311.1 pyrroline-5-carboxylate reductase [Ruminococcus sp.]HOH87025.1 pyrroline-5-carboxylate reductase [Ruminococcus sp.]
MANIGFIGAGNMGSAIMKGISSSSLGNETSLFAFDPSTDKVHALADYGVSACSSEKEIMEKCKYVFLAVKPQIIEGVLEAISAYTTKDTVIISIAAGIGDEFIAKKTISDAKVILVMPNTPLLLGEGASALSRNDKVTDEEFEVVLNIFRICGKAAVIPKDKMKEIIAINGSSPAFIYLFAKGFIDYAASVGIDRAAAEELFTQSLIGSAKMITDSGNTIDELIKMVSSPGGTTLAGLDKLYEGNLTDVVKKCCESCTNRAYELSK